MSEEEFVKESLDKIIEFNYYGFLTQSDGKKILNYINQLQQENKQLKEKSKQSEEIIEEAIDFLKHIINYLEKKDMFHNYESELLDILNKYKKEESE